MSQQPVLNIPPQKDVLKIETARMRAKNWRIFINPKKRSPSTPRGIFIPFTDIQELLALQQLIRETQDQGTGLTKPIYVVGVRAYYSLDMLPMTPPDPLPSVTAILVLVYQVNPREAGSPGEFKYNPHQPSFDLVMPVPHKADKQIPGDAGYYSVFDITQPCPNLCDIYSDLYRSGEEEDDE